MILAGLKTGEIDIGIGRMSDPELMNGLNYELLFLESLKLVVRPNHPLLQENVTLSRVLEWPVVVSPEGTAPRQHSDALVQSQGCKIPSGCIETLSASLSRQLTVEYDYVWFVPSGAVKDDLRHATLVALPVPGHGAGEPIGILPRVDAVHPLLVVLPTQNVCSDGIRPPPQLVVPPVLQGTPPPLRPLLPEKHSVASPYPFQKSPG